MHGSERRIGDHDVLVEFSACPPPGPPPRRTLLPVADDDRLQADLRVVADACGERGGDGRANPPGVPALAGTLTAHSYASKSTIRFTFSAPRLATSGFMASRASSRSPSPVGTTFGGGR